MNDTTYLPRALADGLVLRRTAIEDTEALVAFNAHVHSDVGWDTPDTSVGAWVRDLMTQPHPTFDIGDFLVVEDTATNAIVSSSCLIPQTWSYAGVAFGVGRPELVGTHPDYRRRGLIREQFEVLHQWSTERDQKVQAITGIPWYYRQFGYEMALDLHGSRSGSVADVPQLNEGEDEPYLVRPAQQDDLNLIAELDSLGQERYLIRCLRDQTQWSYELKGQRSDNVQSRALRIIETAEGVPVGFMAHPRFRWGNSLYLTRYELKSGVSWWAVTPSVLRYLKEAGEAYAPYLPSEQTQPFERIAFSMGQDHPSYAVVADRLSKVTKPYAWYIRVSDLPGFLETITPVLERRLADSALVGYTGDLKLNFYRTGVKIVFDQGRIVTIDPWTPGAKGDSGSARFPDSTFLQLLFGYRSLSELDYAFADCTARAEGRLLLDALFPKKASDVWPIS